MEKLKRTELEMLRMMIEAPRAGVREWARRLGIARNTAQARINRLEAAGAITSYRPVLDHEKLGLPVMAYVRLDVQQAQLKRALEALELVPEIAEADSIAGDTDLLCRVVARDHLHLEMLLERLIAIPGVQRTRTEIVLHRRFRPRPEGLIDMLIRDAEEP